MRRQGFPRKCGAWLRLIDGWMSERRRLINRRQRWRSASCGRTCRLQQTNMRVMMFSLLPAVLLSLPASPVDVVAKPLTFKATDPTTGEVLECDRCPPGTYLRAPCTSTQKSDCAPCPEGSYTELWNYVSKCLRCGVCNHDQTVKTECAADRDCECQCMTGYFYKRKYDSCLRHSECPPGQGVLTNGTADENTVCRTCPNGTFSDTTSEFQDCRAHRSCGGAGLQLLLRGSTWHDSVCASCEGNSRDGAAYLKEILPAFFSHHKMSVRRLRRVVHRLLSDGGKREGRTSGLSSSDLHKHINTWVSSATAAQIRQLPQILTNVDADFAGERLQKKLQRIDSHLTELCALGNEVDVDLM